MPTALMLQLSERAQDLCKKVRRVAALATVVADMSTTIECTDPQLEDLQTLAIVVDEFASDALRHVDAIADEVDRAASSSPQ